MGASPKVVSLATRMLTVTARKLSWRLTNPFFSFTKVASCPVCAAAQLTTACWLWATVLMLQAARIIGRLRTLGDQLGVCKAIYCFNVASPEQEAVNVAFSQGLAIQ